MIWVIHVDQVMAAPDEQRRDGGYYEFTRKKFFDT